MDIDTEPSTDAELIERLRALYAASSHSAGARDDFWDCVSYHIGWIVDLAADGAQARAKSKKIGERGSKGGKARMAALSPERRKQIASDAAKARWHRRDHDATSDSQGSPA